MEIISCAGIILNVPPSAHLRMEVLNFRHGMVSSLSLARSAVCVTLGLSHRGGGGGT